MKKSRSMFLDQDTFDVHVMKRGSGVGGQGYEGIHIQVKKWMSPIGDEDTIMISRDALTPEEFDLHIDELISLLEDLRPIGYRKLKQIKKREAAKLKIQAQ